MIVQNSRIRPFRKKAESLSKPKILLICGSLNQTQMMHKLASELEGWADMYYSPFFVDGLTSILYKTPLIDRTIAGGVFRAATENYLHKHNLPMDFKGEQREYDLYITCQDVYYPKKLRKKKVILVQEGMTDPRNLMYYLSRYLKFPRWLASTSTTGLSKKYEKFCVASPGYRNFFEKQGIPPEKLIVTGIPNFDNCAQFLENNFPYRDYVLVATSDTRETLKKDNRQDFIKRALEISAGRQLIFKLHPNEDYERSSQEIKAVAPHALVFHHGNVDHMIANCHTLITQYSTVVYVGIALGKKVHSYFDIAELKAKCPIQNGGTSAHNIAQVVKQELKLYEISQRNTG